MPPGRPLNPGTAEQRAAARRAQVRANVQAFRLRRRESLQPRSSSRDSEAASSGSEHSPEQSLKPGSSTQAQGPAPPEPGQPSTATPNTSTAASSTTSITQIEDTEDLWPPTLPMRIDIGSPYSEAFIAAFQDGSNPNDTPSTDTPSLIRIEVVCSSWVTSVVVEAQSESATMLKDAFVASSLNVLSIERNDPALASTALTIQARSLRSLRQALVQYESNRAALDTNVIYATAMILALSELLTNKSWENFAKHLSGIGGLLQHDGPTALNTLPARKSFYGYRAMQNPFSFLQRRGTFLGERQWIDFPWRGDFPPANHHFHTLLDIAFQIPSEMEAFDKTVPKTLQKLRLQLKTLDAFAEQLLQWRTALLETFPAPTLNAAADSDDAVHFGALDFATGELASSYTYFAGVRLALLDLKREVLGGLEGLGSPEEELRAEVLRESVEWSRTVFQCLEYFLARDRKVLGQMVCLFPFDVAWGVVRTLGGTYGVEVTRELGWCEGTARRLEEMGIPLLSRRFDV